MSLDEVNDTRPNKAVGPNKPSPKKNFPRLVPLFIVFVFIMTGILGGYGSGMGVRSATQKTAESGQLQQEFLMGVKAMDEGLYDVARQNFENIIRIDPNFPGVKTAYADLLMRMQTTPTASDSPTPSITATVDTRGADAQFASAQDLLKSGDYDGTMALLDSLRKSYPDYFPTRVDGMYYQALYQRGMSKLQPKDCNTVNLAGGLYDLSMAERFGPLDKNIQAWRTYVQYYITGASFWDQDWKQAQYYFSQVMLAFPNLMDSSCLTATERWRQATINYADQLYASGDACAASEQYADAFNVNSSRNESVYPTATAAADECSGGNNNNNSQPTNPPVEATPTPTPTPTPTSTTGEAPTDTYTPTSG